MFWRISVKYTNHKAPVISANLCILPGVRYHDFEIRSYGQAI
jgi:hypothetical protein